MTAPDDEVDDYIDLTPYKAARREADEEAPPPGFKLYGQTYVCVSDLLAAPLFDLEVTSRTHGRTVGLYGFLGDVLLPESWTAFEKAFRDPKQPIDLELLDECVSEVLRQFTGRPTKGPSSSPASSSATGQSGNPGSEQTADRSA